MNSPQAPTPPKEPETGRRTGQFFAIGVALFVLVLALGAVFWPSSQQVSRQGKVLVFDPTGDVDRIDSLYRPLAEYLEEISGQEMELQVARESKDFLSAADQGADFLFCPDGLAFQTDAEMYEALVVGRRSAPRNLRPRCVLVYRKSEGLVELPWRSRSDRTVMGDSLSLSAIGALLADGETSLPGCSWGPDSYDHSPVLHAARLGAYDYACVRQWDAERFFEAGLLARTDWGMETLTDPVPDIVLLVSKKIPGSLRMDVGRALAAFARTQDPISPAGETLGRGLPLLRLVGFNILLEPDFARLRGIYKGHWPAVTD